MKRAFSLVEIMIVVAIMACLPIAIPKIFQGSCGKRCANGECSGICRELISASNGPALPDYDMADVRVFCKIMGVEVYDFAASKSLRGYYEEYKRGNLDLKASKR